MNIENKTYLFQIQIMSFVISQKMYKNNKIYFPVNTVFTQNEKYEVVTDRLNVKNRPIYFKYK